MWSHLSQNEFDFLQNTIYLCSILWFNNLIKTEKNTTKNSSTELEVDAVVWKKCREMQICGDVALISRFFEGIYVLLLSALISDNVLESPSRFKDGR